ncbi:MAG: hypothetical protein ACKVOH_00130 [Chlamydiales bacterium]
MNKHLFIFESGVWEGAGEIFFSMAEDRLPFVMSWTILPAQEEKIYFNQVIEVGDFTDKMHNNFCVFDVKEKEFIIELENHLVGRVGGKGVLNPLVLAWEFRNNDQGFEGFEIYERKNDGYTMRAEFTAGEGLRTYVKGSISKIS